MMNKSSKEEFVQIMSVEEFHEEDEEMQCFEIDDKEILICYVEEEDTFHAVSGICTHEFVELCDGELEDSCVICPLHFSRFDLRDGAALDPPAKEPLKVYSIKIEEDMIFIKI